ncbi:hypothetical protein GCM10023162_08680 [Klenkia terrae]
MTGEGVDLFWLPLGAGGWSVRRNGRVLEAVTSRLAGRPAQALVHSALVVRRAGVRSVIEMGPVWNVPGTPAERGSVGTGAVGIRWLGRSRWFRYEVRCWPGGVLPDEAEALGGPRPTTADPALVLRAVRTVPFPTWGRDDLCTGGVWNSNSLTSWLLGRCGQDTELVRPPSGCRAPGWDAGLVLASRQAH